MKHRLLTIAAGSALALGAFACTPPAGPGGQGSVTPPGALACAPIGGTAQPVVHATDTLRPGQWAFDHYDFEAVWPRRNGAGITVAVLDSGVDGRIPDLQGQVLPGQTFITSDNPNGADYNPNPANPDLSDASVNPDPNGHGTEVASLIAAKADGQGIVGAAPSVKILPVVVINQDGNERREVSSSGADDVANAIRWAVNRGANVINMSFGEQKAWPQDEAAITYAESKGVVVVAASGNLPIAGPIYPAAFDNVLAVGGMDSNGELHPLSVTGNYVDVVAPGGDVSVALQPWSEVAFLTFQLGQLYGRESGTSEAAPYASAVAALVRAEHPTWTALQIRQRIEATAIDAGPVGKDQYYGSGLIAPRAAVGC